MTTKIDRVLFDYDGTLIIHDKENEGKQVGSLLGLKEEQMPEFERRLGIFFEKCYSLNNRKMTRAIYLMNMENVIRPSRDFGVTVKQLYDAIMENSKKTTMLANNAISTLEHLVSKGYQLCLFTNGFYDEQIESMKYKGIYEYFEKVYAWDGFYTKPDKRAFFRALAGTNPENNVMIGDSLSADIAPAKEFGMYTVGINISRFGDSNIHPDVVITDLSELKVIL